VSWFLIPMLIDMQLQLVPYYLRIVLPLSFLCLLETFLIFRLGSGPRLYQIRNDGDSVDDRSIVAPHFVVV